MQSVKVIIVYCIVVRDMDWYAYRYRYGRYVRPILTGMYLGINKGRYVPRYQYWPVFKSML
jgi:hypothetical protein